MRISWIGRSAATATLLMLLSTVARGAEAVGIVADYEPVTSRLAINRRGETIALTIGTRVMSGDKITLKTAESVRVTDVDGNVTQINGPGQDMPLALPSAQRLGSIGERLSQLWSYFGEPYRASRMAAAQGGETCLEGGDITVPLFGDASAAIAAGTRDLRFSWRGGCGPFRVSVHDGLDREVASLSVHSRMVRFGDLPLSPGSLTIRIRDTSRTRSVELEVVASRPELPADLAKQSGALGVVAQAFWLAEQDGGRWRFESFDLLAPLIRAGDPLAGKLGDVLMWGREGPAQ